jgi:hypothetical protein
MVGHLIQASIFCGHGPWTENVHWPYSYVLFELSGHDIHYILTQHSDMRTWRFHSVNTKASHWTLYWVTTLHLPSWSISQRHNFITSDILLSPWSGTLPRDFKPKHCMNLSPPYELHVQAIITLISLPVSSWSSQWRNFYVPNKSSVCRKWKVN